MKASILYERLKIQDPIDENVLINVQRRLEELAGLKEPLKYPLRIRQIQALLSFIYKKNNISCFLPTGYGKTFIALLAGLYIYKKYRKRTIIIGLLKALTSEQQDTFSKYAKTIISDGDHKKVDFEDENWVFCCMTPEKFDSIMTKTNIRDILMEDVGLIVTDEVHTLGDQSRGHRIENYLILLKKLFKELRYVNLSATVGNSKEFSDWLETDLIAAKPEERPVPLEINIVRYAEKGRTNARGNYKTRIVALQRLIYKNPNKNWLIFVTSRARTVSVASDVVKTKIRDLNYLMEKKKIGYHNAGMRISDKHEVERAFKAGEISIVVATPTLAVGVNMPADCTVLFDVEEYDILHGSRILNANRIQQTMGRAGRPGYSKVGYTYILTPYRISSEVAERALNPLRVVSQLKPRLHEKILQWFNADAVGTTEDVLEIASYAYADISEYEVRNAIKYLITFEFITEFQDGVYGLTDLGFKTNQMYIAPETVVKWKQHITNVIDHTDFKELFIRFATVNEYMSNIAVRMEDGKVVGYGGNELGSIIPETKLSKNLCTHCNFNNNCNRVDSSIEECDTYETNFFNLLPDAIKKGYFLTFYDDLREKYLPTITDYKTGKIKIKDLPISYGDKMTLKKAGTRMFIAASVIFKDFTEISENLSLLANMVQAGTLNEELAELCKLESVGVVKATKLLKAGIKTIGEFMELSKFKLAKILGCSPGSAEKLIFKNFN